MHPHNIFNVGGPLLEVYEKNKKKILNSNVMKKNSLKKDDFFVISFHRQENLSEKDIFNNFCKFIIYLEKKYKKKIIFSTHPRT